MSIKFGSRINIYKYTIMNEPVIHLIKVLDLKHSKRWINPV